VCTARKARSHCCLGRINLRLKCGWLSVFCSSVASRHVTICDSCSWVVSFRVHCRCPLKGFAHGCCCCCCSHVAAAAVAVVIVAAAATAREQPLLALRLCLVLLLGLYMRGRNKKGVKFSPWPGQSELQAKSQGSIQSQCTLKNSLARQKDISSSKLGG